MTIKEVNTNLSDISDELLINLARLALIKEGKTKSEARKFVKNVKEAERVIAVRADKLAI